jgi:hypothetical protein
VAGFIRNDAFLYDYALRGVRLMDNSYDKCRITITSEILYFWACDRITTQRAKRLCRKMRFDIDFRQPEMAWIEAFDIDTGDYRQIYV